MTSAYDFFLIKNISLFSSLPSFSLACLHPSITTLWRQSLSKTRVTWPLRLHYGNGSYDNWEDYYFRSPPTKLCEGFGLNPAVLRGEAYWEMVGGLWYYLQVHSLVSPEEMIETWRWNLFQSKQWGCDCQQCILFLLSSFPLPSQFLKNLKT